MSQSPDAGAAHPAFRNPVLPGSHPDPSILRVGADYYLATSTFEWYPGVRVHHSRDLAHWRPLGGILDRTRLLDLTGCPDSGGVWAPNLTHTGGLFHLVFGNVSTYAGGFTDCPNYVTTAPSIEGPWSDPVLLHARGFDASLFHDGDTSWLVNLVHDWRPGHGGSAGLEATRYDPTARRLVGDPVRIQLPPGAGWIEGPNLYRHGDRYYLVTADGGTGYDHQVTVSRSRHLAGPYERDRNGPLLTARHRPDWPLQKAGHGSLVRTPADDWYLAYLVARPHGTHGPCVLGRETALTPVRWADGWPTVPGGLPPLEVAAPGPRSGPGLPVADVDGFDRPRLGPQWSTLRRPADPGWVSLTERPSHLRIRGGRSPRSLVGPSLVARRVTDRRCAFDATVEYRPRTFGHLAGITAYYNTRNWHHLHVTADDTGTPVLRVATSDRGALAVHPTTAALTDGAPVRLGLDLDGAELRFRYDTGAGWQPAGPGLDATVLSDEHAAEFDGDQIRTLGFTGAFVGLWVWDLDGHGHHADFDDAVYTADPAR
ncbi:family 43 glycosylhydrolase [Polymorphospora rubra]|uniref:Glycoside hydrolase 43 family protein n=1 Tax=Polymorphospora rubra TaxID=338584 RepID=A0A810NAU4_9ACTN|nr:family 43 glycosylhydrolase [Polymorphospora rubra]BCJ68465.1 glycoside hydrolase 43 family protein [Polymorphospora rubra]